MDIRGDHDKPIITIGYGRGSHARHVPITSCARSDRSCHSSGLLPSRHGVNVLGNSKMGTRRPTRNEAIKEGSNTDHSGILDSLDGRSCESDRGAGSPLPVTATSSVPISVGKQSEYIPSALKPVTLQIVPNRGVTNHDIETLLRAIWGLYRPPLRRLERIDSTLVYALESGTWEIFYSGNSVRFALTVPYRWKSHFKEKIAATWPQATVEEISRPIAEKYEVVEMKFKNHYFMSLNASKRESSLLNALVPVVRDLSEDDKAIVQFVMVPESDGWRTDAMQAKNEFSHGHVRHRMEFDTRTGARLFGEMIDGVFSVVTETIGELIDAHPAKDHSKVAKIRGLDQESQGIVLDGGLSSYTHQKATNKGYDVTIRIAVLCTDKQRTRIIMKSIITALQLLNGDNELVVDRPRDQAKAMRQLMNCESSTKLNKDIFSMQELLRVVAMPGATLLAEYPEITQLNRRDVTVSHTIFDCMGYELGEVTDRWDTKTAKIQVSNYDVLCLPHCVLGKMGCGKSNGQGANTALGFLKSGFSAFVVDVADGKLIDTIRDSIPAGFREDHIIDLDFGNTAWPLPLSWSEVACKVGAHGGDSMEARKAANRLSAQLVNFISQLSTYDTSDRMQRYLSAAGKVELVDPRASILEVILLLASDAYRKDRLDRISNPRLFDTIKGLHDLAPGARGQITQPILDRLDILLSNEAMGNCILQRQKVDEKGKPLIDFRKWLDGDEGGPYFVGIRVPKEELLDVATDRIVTFLIAKVWLAILSRYDQKESLRKPCVFIMDEPHQFMSAKPLWDDMIREARKWRLKMMFLAHNFRDFGTLSKTFKDSGMQYSIYSTSKETYLDLAEELAPFSLEDLLVTPDRWYAVNKIVVPDAGVQIPAFLAKMMQPPRLVKDRSFLREKCSRFYGQSVSVVEQDIYEREQVLYQGKR